MGWARHRLSAEGRHCARGQGGKEHTIPLSLLLVADGCRELLAFCAGIASVPARVGTAASGCQRRYGMLAMTPRRAVPAQAPQMQVVQMSEYQRYEWMTSDRPLTRAQLEAVNALSSPIDATPTRAIVQYPWSTLTHDPLPG